MAPVVTPGLHMGRDHVQGLGDQAAGLAHPLEILGAVDADGAGTDQDVGFQFGRFVHGGFDQS